jgi:cell division protein ZapA
MSETYAHVSIRILGKEYQVACPIEEKSALLASAELLNEKMQDIRSTGKVLGLDRVAVMAALNLANELIKRNDEDRQLKDIFDLRVKAMRERLDSALGPGQQLSL